MIDGSVLLACFISLFGVAVVSYVGQSHYRGQRGFRYLINFLWFSEIFIWVSVLMLWA
jgi:amino acid permease